MERQGLTRRGNGVYSEVKGRTKHTEPETDTMRTIPKNHTKIIADIFDRATSAKCYSLDGGFVGRDVEPEVVKRVLESGRMPKLVDMEDGTYKVRVHSNLWYEVDTAANRCGCGAAIGEGREVCHECQDPEEAEAEFQDSLMDPEEDLVAMECAVAVNRYRKARIIADGLLENRENAERQGVIKAVTVAELSEWVHTWSRKPGADALWAIAAQHVGKGEPSAVTRALVLAMLRDAAEAEARLEVAQ